MTEKDYKFVKANYSRKAFGSLARGLLFSEKEGWKKRRKIMSEVFNYNFITKFSERMAEIF